MWKYTKAKSYKHRFLFCLIKIQSINSFKLHMGKRIEKTFNELVLLLFESQINYLISTDKEKSLLKR